MVAGDRECSRAHRDASREYDRSFFDRPGGMDLRTCDADLYGYDDHGVGYHRNFTFVVKVNTNAFGNHHHPNRFGHVHNDDEH